MKPVAGIGPWLIKILWDDANIEFKGEMVCIVTLPRGQICNFNSNGGVMGQVLLRVGAVIFAVLAGVSSTAAQQQPFYEFRACDGDISSLALEAIPEADAYTVDIFDPTETALRFREIFLAELTESAKATREDGNLVFSFRSESIFRGITSRGGVSPTYRGDESISRSSPRTDEDETRELIRNDRRGRGGSGQASQQVLVEAELRNNETQRVIWLATVRCQPLTNDRNVLMKFVSEVFVENLGMAVKQKAF